MQLSRDVTSENSLMGKNGPRWMPFAHAGAILAAAGLAVAPIAIYGPSCGADFRFHVSSWIDIRNAWIHGIPYPHWAQSPNFGAGEPRFVFYPPLTGMLGAMLGLVLPWTILPLVMTFLLLSATGFATRALARSIMSKPAATLAGCAAIFSGYALSAAYLRTAYAELSGGFWTPLLILFALRDRASSAPNTVGGTIHRAFDGSALPLALVVAGAWLSNAPVGVITCYLLAALALTHAWQTQSWSAILRAFVSTALGMALAAFYLLPATVEQRWVAISNAIDAPGKRIEENWIFKQLNDPAIWWHKGEIWKTSMVTVAMIGITLTCGLIAYRRGALQLNSPERRRWWIPLFLIPVFALILQFPISHPIWNVFPRLRFLQFPWRWLVAAESPMAITLAAAVWSFRSRGRKVAIGLCVAFFVFSTMLTVHSFFVACTVTRSLPAFLGSYASGQGLPGTPEYLPPHADAALLTPGLPESCLTDGLNTPLLNTPLKDLHCDQQFPLSTAGHDGQEHISLTGNADHSGYLILHVLSFPAWHITVNGNPADSLPANSPIRTDGLIAIPIPQGPVTVSVDWVTTRDVILGRSLTCASLLLLAALWLLERRFSLERRLTRPHLSSK